MAQFTFKVKDQNGIITAGVLEAPDKDTALKILTEKNLVVTSLNQAASDNSLIKWGANKVKGEELLTFTQSLASMLDAGISLKKSVDILAVDIENPYLRRIAIELSSGLAQGEPLSDIMRRYPKVFSNLYLSLVAAGESTGELPSTLYRMADYIEKSENLKKKIQSAFYYPTIVVCFAFIIVAGIFLFGIPRIEGIYQGFGTQLPAPTRAFIAFSHLLTRFWFLILLLLAALGYALGWYLKTEAGQLLFDGLKLKILGFGVLFKRLAIARFSRTLSVLYASGVPIISALNLVASGTGNKVIEKVILNSAKNLHEGGSIVEPLRDSKIFTNMAVSMIASGEETGSLDKMLNKLANFYENQVDITLQGLAGLIEPIIMVVLGVIIAGVIIVVGLPFLMIGTVVQ